LAAFAIKLLETQTLSICLELLIQEAGSIVDITKMIKLIKPSTLKYLASKLVFISLLLSRQRIIEYQLAIDYFKRALRSSLKAFLR